MFSALFLLPILTWTLSNIDARFQEHRYLVFPSKSLHTDGIRAGVMSSFGFGQVGGTALVVHPRYLFGALEPSQYAVYQARNRTRSLQAYKAMSEMMITNSLVKIKEAPPYPYELEQPVLMNPLARASLDPKTGSYSFSKLQKEPTLDLANVKAVSEVLAGNASASGVGVDQGELLPLIMIYDLIIDAHLTRTHLFGPLLEPDLRGTQLHRS